MSRTSDLVAYLADPEVMADLAAQLREQRAAGSAPVEVVTVDEVFPQ